MLLTIVILTSSIGTFAGMSAWAIHRSRSIARNIHGRNIHISPSSQHKNDLN